MEAIRDYERGLGERFIDGAARVGHRLRPADDGGPRADVPRSTSTASRPTTSRRALAERGIGVWAHDSWYCVGLAERLPAEGSLRIGFIHYNTADEVDRLAAELGALSS